MAAASEAARMEDLKSRYMPLIPPEEKVDPYRSKMVGLNPNMKPGVSASRANLFPMAGLWSQKKLLKTTVQTMGVSEEEQISLATGKDKRHNKAMYPQKEYMEEYLKFKDVIGNMKK